jgi:hypothetical protein
VVVVVSVALVVVLEVGVFESAVFVVEALSSVFSRVPVIVIVPSLSVPAASVFPVVVAVLSVAVLSVPVVSEVFSSPVVVAVVLVVAVVVVAAVVVAVFPSGQPVRQIANIETSARRIIIFSFLSLERAYSKHGFLFV